MVSEIHENAKAHGWWDGEERTFGELIALCHSELSEALEEYRADRPMYWRACAAASGIPCMKSVCHPEEIHPCPVWSEESIRAARAAELLGFAQVFRRFEEGSVVVVSETGFAGCLACGFFPEIQPGQTVQLSEIR